MNITYARLIVNFDLKTRSLIGYMEDYDKLEF